MRSKRLNAVSTASVAPANVSRSALMASAWAPAAVRRGASARPNAAAAHSRPPLLERGPGLDSHGGVHWAVAVGPLFCTLGCNTSFF
jgi:hypothetical protein